LDDSFWYFLIISFLAESENKQSQNYHWTIIINISKLFGFSNIGKWINNYIYSEIDFPLTNS
jgi:hypothetical protein